MADRLGGRESPALCSLSNGELCLLCIGNYGCPHFQGRRPKKVLVSILAGVTTYDCCSKLDLWWPIFPNCVLRDGFGGVPLFATAAFPNKGAGAYRHNACYRVP